MVGAALVPVLLVLLVAAGGGLPVPGAAWAVVVALTAVAGAVLLAGYVPARGQRAADVLGCGPCDAASGLSVVGAAALLAAAPQQVTMALAALAVVGVGLVRRRGAAERACPRP